MLELTKRFTIRKEIVGVFLYEGYVATNLGLRCWFHVYDGSMGKTHANNAQETW